MGAFWFLSTIILFIIISFPLLVTLSEQLPVHHKEYQIFSGPVIQDSVFVDVDSEYEDVEMTIIPVRY